MVKSGQGRLQGRMTGEGRAAAGKEGLLSTTFWGRALELGGRGG